MRLIYFEGRKGDEKRHGSFDKIVHAVFDFGIHRLNNWPVPIMLFVLSGCGHSEPLLL